MSSPNQNPNDQQNWLLVLLNELGKYTMSIIVIIVLFLLLWVVPQIKDLIVAINQANDHWFVVFIFFASLSVMAFLITTVGTYFRRLKEPLSMQDNGDLNVLESDAKSSRPSIFQVPMDDKEQYIESQDEDISILSSSYEDKENQQQYIQRMFPKILGTLLILIAAFAVNNTYQMIYDANLIISGNWGLIICFVLLLAILNQKWMNAITKWFLKFKIARYIPIGIAILCLVTIMILGLFNRGGAEGDIVRLFYALILLAIFFLLITTSYNKLIIKFKKRIGAPLIIVLVIGALISYIILFFNPQGLKFFTPLPIVMICIIGMYTLLNLIKLLGVVLRLPLFGITLFVCLVLGIYTANNPNFSHYDATSVGTTIKPSDRLELDEYVKLWIADRKEGILDSTTEDKFPILLVSAEGGGSRAGLWSFLIQSYLYDRNPDYFEKYLFAMTGASGGGVGNNMFYSQAYQLQEGNSAVTFKYQNPENGFNYRASNVYNKDYLSTSVASLLGRDLFKSITNMFVFDDRGALLEDEWQTAFDKVFEYENPGPLGKAYLEIMPKKDSDNILPIVVTNTTHLQSGERAVVSPVSIKNDMHNMAVFMDLLAEYPDKEAMIKRSTAMSMNARFPYISPAARIKGVGQFGDAGYYDNIGGTVTRRLALALKNEIEKDTSLTGKYEIKHLLITNYEGEPKLTYSTQLAAPLSMIWNATFAHPKEMEKTFTNVHNIQSKRTEIPQGDALLTSFMRSKSTSEDEEVTPFIPLGRYLSDIAVRSLEERLIKVEDELNKIIPEKKP